MEFLSKKRGYVFKGLGAEKLELYLGREPRKV